MSVSSAVTIYTAKQSFSCMKKINNYTHLTMNYLTILSIDTDILLSLDFEDIISNLISKKSRHIILGQ